MTKPTPKTWLELALESSMLGAEMSMVIWLRSMRMIAGGIEQSAQEVTGCALAHYGKPVRANRRRLSR